MAKMHNKKISKTLSWVLRFGILELGLDMDDHGYVLLSDLLALTQFSGVTVDQINEVVHSNDKQRFTLKGNSIRANQGHSKEIGSMIVDDCLLKPLSVVPRVCVHGTTKEAWEYIKSDGLRPMGRRHIHMATNIRYPERGLTTDIKTGLKAGSKVMVYVDVKRAVAAGKRFYVSDNGVVLCPDHLDVEFIERVTGVLSKTFCAGVIVFWEDSVVLVHTKTGKYGFPKGKYDTGLDVDCFHNAIRELEEETGVKLSDIELYSGVLDERQSVRYYIARLKKHVNLSYPTEELGGVGYYSVESAMKLLRVKHGEILQKAIAMAKPSTD